MNEFKFGGNEKKRSFEDEVDLLPVAKFVYNNMKSVVTSICLFVILSVIYCQVANEVWRSEATLMLPSGEVSKGINLQGLGDIASLSSLFSGKKVNTKVIKSRRMANYLIDKFGLITYYKLENTEKDRYSLIKQIQKSIIVESSNEDSTITLSVDMDTPVMAKNVAYEVILYTNTLINELNIIKAKEQRLFLESRISEIEKKINEQEELINQFSLKNNLLDLETQGRSSIENIALLLRKIQELEISIPILSDSLGTDNPEYKAKVSELGLTKLKYEMFLSDEEFNKHRDELYPLIPVTNLTRLKIESDRFGRELKVLGELLKNLRLQYEMVKLDEKKDDIFLRILDYPTLPVYRQAPKKKIIVALFAVLGFIVGVMVVLFKFYLVTIRDSIGS